VAAAADAAPVLAARCCHEVGDRAQVGIAYRPELGAWIDQRPPQIEVLEVAAEPFYKGGWRRLRFLAGRYPIRIRCAGLSLGTPGPLDNAELGWLRSVAEAAQARSVSTPLGFRRTSEVDLGFPVPVPLDRDTLDRFRAHIQELSAVCGRPVLIQNIASPLRVAGELDEPEFLNRLCEVSGCGILLDLTALAVNGYNHHFNPRTWLERLDRRRVVQLLAGGYSERGRHRVDLHAGHVSEEVLDLARAALDSPSVAALVLERDREFPPLTELEEELGRLRAVVESRGPVEGVAS
jgi:uncharacterized protein (UPF0276 family)